MAQELFRRKKRISEDVPAPLLKRRKKAEITYLSGGEGFIKWCEEYVNIKIYIDGVAVWCPLGQLPTKINPDTGRCSKDMWDFQCSVARDALKMVNGKFIKRLIVLCWMRGEGKSLFVCLIQLWKFYNFPAQQIMLGANSKDQVKFVHYDIMRDIILNSPKLIRIVGERNVQEKEIRLKNSKGHIVSIIRSISSFSGIVSNITGYTFSEIFDMNNPKFFTQLDGSIRNIPNALGVIDSTVSAKSHILYKLYDTWKKGLDRTLFFSHRDSPKASHKDFTNPEMTQVQLNSYKAKFPSREFAMYFKNTWDAGSKKMFTEESFIATQYVGYRNSLGEYNKVLATIQAHLKAREENKVPEDEDFFDGTYAKMQEDLIPISSIYQLETDFHQPRSITMDELEKLGDIFNTDWALCVGVDRADPMKINILQGARTIISLIAKGLPGSRNNPAVLLQEDTTILKYMYFQIDLKHIQHSDINTIKGHIEGYVNKYDGVDSLCTERWGMWDIGEWCENLEIQFFALTASYPIQKEGFSEMYALINEGRFKSPETVVRGNKKDNILEEEFLLFDHDPVRKFYGTPEKKEKLGVQDDCMFAINWAIYGGRFIGAEDFRSRNIITSLGSYYEDTKSLVGNYK